MLPPYRRRFEDVDKTLHELWIQGLSTRDFEPSLRALLGEETPLSPSTISRVNKQLHDEYDIWCRRPISNEYVYAWADGVYLGARLADERRVMLVVMGLISTTTRLCSRSRTPSLKAERAGPRSSKARANWASRTSRC